MDQSKLISKIPFFSIAVFGLYFLYYVSRCLLFRFRLSTRCCQPIPAYAQKIPYFGSDFLKAYRNAVSGGYYIEFMQKQYARYGRTFSATISGNLWVFTCDPDNLRAIHTSMSPVTVVEPMRKASGKGFMGDGMFISDGDKWKDSRVLFKPLFARAQISDFRPLARHVDRLFDLLPQDGSTVDLQPMLKAMYNDISTESLLGNSIGCQGSGQTKLDADAFDKSFEIALVGMFKHFSSGIRNPWSKEYREWTIACQEIHCVLDQYIERAEHRRADGEKPQQLSMLDELLPVSTNRVFLRDQLLNILLGAKDTAGMGIAQIFFHLARQPEAWKKLRHEVLEMIDSGRPITFESLKTMNYLQCVLSESLRLHSPVDIALRDAGCEFELPRGGGQNASSPTLVPRGARIESCFTVLHRDRGIWGEDAEQFRPERWIGGPLHRWDYLPFSGGARICPAQQTVLAQYGYILVRFAERFEEICNRDPELEFVTEIIFAKQSKNDVQVALHPAK